MSLAVSTLKNPLPLILGEFFTIHVPDKGVLGIFLNIVFRINLDKIHWFRIMNIQLLVS